MTTARSLSDYGHYDSHDHPADAVRAYLGDHAAAYDVDTLTALYIRAINTALDGTGIMLSGPCFYALEPVPEDHDALIHDAIRSTDIGRLAPECQLAAEDDGRPAAGDDRAGDRNPRMDGLLREALVLGFATGAWWGGWQGGREGYPTDTEVVTWIMRAARTHRDIYPTLASLPVDLPDSELWQWTQHMVRQMAGAYGPDAGSDAAAEDRDA